MTLDELTGYGVEWMDEADIHEFLIAQGVGVLGLPTDDLPYMIPMSYGYDGDEYLYFYYVVGETSQKVVLTEETSSASFLVFAAPSEAHWTSVALEGALTSVPEKNLQEVKSEIGHTWNPNALVEAKTSEETRMYRFWIQNARGIRQVDVPSDMNE